MTQEQAAPQAATATKRSFGSRYRVALALAGVLLLLLGILVLLPWVIAQQAEKWITQHGGDSFNVANVDFNPFKMVLVLDDAQVRHGGSDTLLLQRMELDAQWSGLLDRHVVINQCIISGLSMHMGQHSADDAHIGGILLRTLEAPGTPAETDDSQPWTVAIQQLTLQDSRFDYRDPKLQMQLDVNQLRLAGLDTLKPDQPAIVEFRGKIADAPVSLSGKLAVLGQAPGFTGDYKVEGLDLGLFNGYLPTSVQTLKALLTSAGQLTVTQTGQGLTSTHAGDLEVSELSLAMATQQLQVRQIRWQGKTDFAQQGEADLSLAVAGKLASSHLQLALPEQSLAISNGQFDWAGSTQLNLAGDSQQYQVSGDMGLQESGMVQSGEPGLRVAVEEMQVSAFNLNDQLQLHLAELVLKQLSLAGAAADSPILADLAAYVLKDLELLDSSRGSAAELAVTGLRLADPNAKDDLPLFVSQQLEASDISWDLEDSIQVGTVQQNGVRTRLQQSADGVWNVQTLADRLAGMATPAPGTPGHITAVAETAATTAAESESAPVETTGETNTGPAIVIGSYELSGDNRLDFTDLSSDPVFTAGLDVTEASIKNVNTGDPASISELLARLAVDGGGSLDLKGTLTPAAQRLTTDLQVEISALPLPPLSVFAARAIGHQLDSGEMNAEINFKADNGQVEGKNKLVFHQLQVSPLDDETLKKIGGEKIDSLETGLSMLRDKNNTITLDVPLSGDIDDLKVDPSDIINQAIASALQTGAKTYLAAALFPLGTLLVVADAASSAASAISLTPAEFSPASASLDDSQTEYLAKIAKVLEDRPEMNILVCGFAVESDRSAMLASLRAAVVQQATSKEGAAAKVSTAPVGVADDKLLELARQRAETIDRFLIQQQGVSDERLISCREKIDQAADGKPRVELQL